MFTSFLPDVLPYFSNKNENNYQTCELNNYITGSNKMLFRLQLEITAEVKPSFKLDTAFDYD